MMIVALQAKVCSPLNGFKHLPSLLSIVVSSLKKNRSENVESIWTITCFTSHATEPTGVQCHVLRLSVNHVSKCLEWSYFKVKSSGRQQRTELATLTVYVCLTFLAALMLHKMTLGDL